MLPFLKQFEVSLQERLPHAEGHHPSKERAPEHKGELEGITAHRWNVSGPPSEPLSLITSDVADDLEERQKPCSTKGQSWWGWVGRGRRLHNLKKLEGILNDP